MSLTRDSVAQSGAHAFFRMRRYFGPKFSAAPLFSQADNAKRSEARNFLKNLKMPMQNIGIDYDVIQQISRAVPNITYPCKKFSLHVYYIFRFKDFDLINIQIIIKIC